MRNNTRELANLEFRLNYIQVVLQGYLTYYCVDVKVDENPILVSDAQNKNNKPTPRSKE